jgi:hypothetical protein
MTELQLPKRIILSRKGVDSAAGGIPSLLCDNELLGIPIREPEFKHTVTYGDVNLPEGPWSSFKNFGELVQTLTVKKKVPLRADTPIHLDPDIRPELHQKPENCTEALGQCCEPDGRLREVGAGDLFLFFGWFANAAINGKIVKLSDHQEHTIWGWLQTKEPLRAVAPSGNPAHPHEYPRKDPGGHDGGHNSLYYATASLTFNASKHGCGPFKTWNEALRLTHPSCRHGCRSVWRLPRFFEKKLDGVNLDAIWTTDGDFVTVQPFAQQQEYLFAVPNDPEIQAQVADWLARLWME